MKSTLIAYTALRMHLQVANKARQTCPARLPANSFPATCLHICYSFCLKCISFHSLPASYWFFRCQLKTHFLKAVFVTYLLKLGLCVIISSTCSYSQLNNKTIILIDEILNVFSVFSFTVFDIICNENFTRVFICFMSLFLIGVLVPWGQGGPGRCLPYKCEWWPNEWDFLKFLYHVYKSHKCRGVQRFIVPCNENITQSQEPEDNNPSGMFTE